MASLRWVLLAGVFSAAAAQAQDSAPSRYRVSALNPPAAVSSECLPGYGANYSAVKINDFGVVNGVSNCYTVVDDVTPQVLQKGRAYVIAPGSSGFELPTFNPGYSYSYSVNNRGELFGYEAGPAETGGLFAARWTLSGTHERIFFDPHCDNIQFQAGVESNGRYTVGWGLRGDPSLPPPADLLCIRTRWLIRDAAGVETYGPLDGSPTDINAQDVAVGYADRAAIRYHVPSGQLTVLHAADSAHSSEAFDINDLGDVAGRITTNSQPDTFCFCDPSVAVRWDGNGRERVLPHLPGAVSSKAYAVGYDGETVGDSGAGQRCGPSDNNTERATLWKGGRAYDLNSLIPRSASVTLIYAFAVNRRGQITAGGFVNSEPLASCPRLEWDAATSSYHLVSSPCRNIRMFVLTPLGR